MAGMIERLLVDLIAVATTSDVCCAEVADNSEVSM
jgi:hypothetical protein